MSECPVDGCDEQLEEPIAIGHASGFDQSFHTHRDCPKCGTPLTYTFGGDAKGWSIDLGEKRRRELLGD